MFSLNDFEGLSASSMSSVRDISGAGRTSFTDHMHRQGDISAGNSSHYSVSEVAKNSNGQVSNSDDGGSLLKSDSSTNEAKKPVFLDEISSSVDEGSSKQEGLLENCGILPNNCLPCLAPIAPTVEKRRSLSSSPPSARKKTALKLSFKWKEGHPSATLCEYLSKSLSRFPFDYFKLILLLYIQFLPRCCCRDQ